MKRFMIFLIVVCFIGCSGSEQKQAQEQNKKATADLLTTGFDYLSKSDVPNAIKNFDLAIKSDPSDSTNYIVLGQVYLRLNNISKAIDTFNAATKIDPDNGDLFHLLGFIYAARADEGDRAYAIEKTKRSIEIFLAEKNQEKLLKSMALLQNITGVNIGQASNSQ
jgi:Tfp pilus assembly protein PilF